MAPTAAALIHLPTEELHAGCLQLPHSGGEIVDHEANNRTSGEVRVVLVVRAEHLERAPPSGNWKAAKSDSSWLVVSPRTAWGNATMAGYSLVLVPAQPMRLTRILASPCSDAPRPQSCHNAALFEQGQRPTTVTRRIGAVQAIGLAALSTRGSSLAN
jgi:hypothetical protein